MEVSNPSRSCTDKLWLLILIAVTVLINGMLFWTSSSASAGGDVVGVSWDRALYGPDFQNNVCGEADGPQASRPYYSMPALLDFTRSPKKLRSKKVLRGSTRFRVCVESCEKVFAYGRAAVATLPPYETQFLRNTTMYFGVESLGIPHLAFGHMCVPDIAKIKQLIADNPLKKQAEALARTVAKAPKSRQTDLQKAAAKAALDNVMGASPTKSLDVKTIADILGATTYVERLAASDWSIVWDKGIPVILAVCIAYLILIRYASGFLVWLMLLLVLLILVIASLILSFCFDEEEDHAHASDETATSYHIAGYVVGGLAVIYLFMLLFMRKRINYAINITKLAARAVMSIPSSVLIPLIVFVVQLLFLVYFFVLVSFFMEVRTDKASKLKLLEPFTVAVDGIDTQVLYFDSYDMAKKVKYFIGFVAFYGLWVHETLWYFSYLSLAGGIAQWVTSPKNVNCGFMFRSAFRSAYYHLGTCAFAGFILSCVKVLRTVARYIHSKMSGQANQAAQAIMTCVECFLACLQTIVDKLNRYALVMTALDGSNLLTSGSKVLVLFAKNMARVAAMSWVSAKILLAGMLIVPAASGALTAIWVRNDNDEWATQMFPIAVTIVLAYIFCSFVFVLLRVAMDTLFVCVLQAEEMGMSADGTSLLQKHFTAALKKSSAAMEKQGYSTRTMEHSEGDEFSPAAPVPPV
eukprot:73160_1